MGVCSGVAGDPKGAVLLIGLGVTGLGMPIPSIATVKAQLRRLSLKKCRAYAQEALACRTAAAVRSLAVPAWAMPEEDTI